MYKEQRERLVANKALGLTGDQATSIVARAYGYTSIDLKQDQLVDPINGLMKIKTPAEIKAIPDRALQMMEFLRMSQNMVAPGMPDILTGHPQGSLIAIMWGFSNFDALKSYAMSDKIDPTSTDPRELARFKARTGFIAPSQYLLGRDYTGNTLIIHTESHETSQWIDQEICLNNLADLQVAVVRCNADGDDYINRFNKNHDVFRQPLAENHSSYLLGARRENPQNRLAVSIIPNQTYTLEHLVAAHYSALGENAVRGRSLIIDRVPLVRDLESITAGLRLARSMGLNLVYVTDSPDENLWQRFESRLIFGFKRHMDLSTSEEMNTALLYASPFIGLKGHNLHLVFNSTESGSLYTIVQLVPDVAPKGAQLMKRIFGTPRLG
ncbi:hypothetical protein [Pseudomonas sp. NPDC089569]|uniref:hypothetical protein n=1 Tax=Pseudomonas sp. NPDC089569 TaxID=3390722 RepID=UPI003D00298D